MRDRRVSARIGVWLGVSFAICFVTGLLSHLIQSPPGWFVWPTRPIDLYRINQGLHVFTGIAAIPLLLAKLYTVYPKLFTWPPFRSIAHLLERLSILVLIAAAFFQLSTGLLNYAEWFPWSFGFPAAHYAMGWVAIGALLVHLAVKLPVILDALRSPVEQRDAGEDDSPPPGTGPSRRAFIGAALVSAGAVVVATVGNTVPALRRVSVLAPRSGDGPQGLPVNKTALSARVVESAQDPAYRLEVVGPAGTRSFSVTELEAMSQRTESLPIACVQGWSADAVWSGVRVSELTALVGATGEEDVRFVSLQQSGRYKQSVLPARHARDPLTLVALRVNGEVLDLDHGYPCRLIAPSRPGVLQTKWVARVEVLT